MRPVRRGKEPLGLKPLYTAAELARSLGISRDRLVRLLQMHDVRIYRVGRGLLVPVSEIQQHLAPLWASLRDHERNRDDVE